MTSRLGTGESLTFFYNVCRLFVVQYTSTRPACYCILSALLFLLKAFHAARPANIGLTILYIFTLILLNLQVCTPPNKLLKGTKMQSMGALTAYLYRSLSPFSFFRFNKILNLQLLMRRQEGGEARERRGFLDDVTELLDYPSPHLRPPPSPLPPPPHA